MYHKLHPGPQVVIYLEIKMTDKVTNLSMDTFINGYMYE